MKRFAKLCTALIVALSLLVSISNAQIQIQGPRASEDAYSGVVYGPIDSSDTLWRIASRYKQDTQFSVYQTMLAIYQLNPRSFENNNFNTMVDGAMLQMPSDEYIARMDPRRAKAKADADERNFSALGRGSVDEKPSTEPQPSAPVQEVVPAEVNLKDAPPLVNQDDLSKTQKQLQDQLNALNRQQNNQFESVKEQVSASIENVQSLIDENKKLYERLDQVNTDIADLRTRVEGEMQSQIDEQLTMQRELLDLIKAEQAKQAEDADNSWINLAKSPTGLIAISTSITLIILGLIAYLLLRRKSEPEQAPAEQTTGATEDAPASEDIVDDELVIGEAIDEVDEDTDELLKALSDDAEEDDVLSEQLEDGLDEIPVDKNVDDFAELEDEMLVPDSTEQVAEEEETEAEAEELQPLEEAEEAVSFDSDAISLDEDDFDNQSIDLSSETEATDELEPAPESSQESGSEEPAEAKAPAAANNIAVDPSATVSDVPEGIQLNEDGEVDDNTIDLIEQKIQEKDAEITQLTNEILEELETASSEEASEEDVEESAGEDAEDVSPDDIDALLAGVNTESDEDSVTAESTAEAEELVTDEPTDELIKEDPIVETSEEASDKTDVESNESVEDSIEQDVSDIDIDALIAAESAPDTTVDDVDVSEETPATEAIDDDADAVDIDDDADAVDIDDDADAVDIDDDADAVDIDDIVDSVLDAKETAVEEDAPAPESDSADVADAKDTVEQDALATPVENEDLDSLTDEISNELEDDIIADEELDSLLDEFTAEMEANAFASELPEDDIDISEVLEKASLEDDNDTLKSAVSDEDTSLDLPEDNDEPLSDVITDDFEHIKSDLDEGMEQLNSEQPLEELSSELDEDILADLPEVDDWVDSIDQEAEAKSELIDGEPEYDKDEIEQLLDEDLLSVDGETKSSDDTDAPAGQSDEQPSDEMAKAQESDKPASKTAQSNPLNDAGLDVDALMTDMDDGDFTNVDDLIAESESLPPLSDDDLELNLDGAFANMMEAQSDDVEYSLENYQSSNLDLAQIYIDMEDFESATDVLREVLESGSDEQKAEAQALLKEIEKA